MTGFAQEDLLAGEIEEINVLGLTRQRRVLQSPCGRLATVDGQELLNFASNDYLGLAANPEIAAALSAGALQWGAGSGASHLVSGHLAPHEQLENELASFLGFPKTLTFSTGYMANLAIVPSLAGRGAAIFADKLNHASLIDAVQLAKAQGAECHRYAHNDVSTLEKLLATSTAKTKLIVTDAVFSMDGDFALLPVLLELAGRYDAWLIIDDAHGFGLFGPHGEGSLAHFNLAYQPRILLMGTLGKAAGVAGAFIAGSETAINYLLQRARSYIFTTAAPPAVACALSKSLDIIRHGDALRRNLFARIGQLREGTGALPWKLLASATAIQALIIGENTAALKVSTALREQGFWVPAIRPPTVPKGTARLRISLSAAHTEDDVSRLIAALKALA